MFNLDDITNKNNKKHNKKWPFIPDHPYRILIIGGSGSGKPNTLLNLITQQSDIDKIYLYVKDFSEIKYEFLIKKHQDPGIKHNFSKAFIECSNTIDDVYDYNPIIRRKILIVFDDIIADTMSNKKIQAVVKDLFIRCRKLIISLVFITQSNFSIAKDVKLN